ncbi:MAG TPA: HemK/PrmC family methyltransferase [Clostridia bacterium]|nr:HemK/PrmC family methyltransferase [Clostridia bacterium]
MRNTIKNALAFARAYLKDKDIENPSLDAEVLLAECLGLTRASLYANWEREINAREQDHFSGLVKRRGRGEPVAYLVGHKEFMGLKFTVNPHVLIPRPETELLVEKALKILQNKTDSPLVVDVGTGSGAIAVSIAKHNSNTRVFAIDKSVEALNVAQVNGENHGVNNRLFFRCGNLLEPLESGPDTGVLQRAPRRLAEGVLGLPGGVPDTGGDAAGHRGDAPYTFGGGPDTGMGGVRPGSIELVVANLPYIPGDEIPALPRDVGFEPRIALDGGPDGLALYGDLLVQSYKWLRRGGYLLAEIGADQGPKVFNLVEKFNVENEPKRWFSQLLDDLAGRNRLLCVQKVYN